MASRRALANKSLQADAERQVIGPTSDMQTYAERTGRRPDFRVRYRWIDEQAPGFHQRPFQHMRCDFSYEGDDLHRDGIYMIWPEFEDATGIPFPETSPVPTEGVAAMWIVVPEMRRSVHQAKARVGVKGYFMAGGNTHRERQNHRNRRAA